MKFCHFHRTITMENQNIIFLNFWLEFLVWKYTFYSTNLYDLDDVYILKRTCVYVLQQRDICARTHTHAHTKNNNRNENDFWRQFDVLSLLAWWLNGFILNHQANRFESVSVPGFKKWFFTYNKKNQILLIKFLTRETSSWENYFS